jgi:hypothetical protein
MRRALATLAIAAAGFAAAGCGKDNGSPIPRTDADALIKSIEQVHRQSDSGACSTLLTSTLPALETRAGNLPPSVGSSVRDTITNAINHLRDLATEDCNNKQNQTNTTTTDTSTSDTTPSTTDTTPSTDTSTSDTSTSDTTTNTDTTTSTQTTPPPTTGTNTNTGGGGVTPPTTPPTTGTTP